MELFQLKYYYPCLGYSEAEILKDSKNIPYMNLRGYRSDMGCGSTIGPITAKELGIRTSDIGLKAFIQGMGIRRDEIQDCL